MLNNYKKITLLPIRLCLIFLIFTEVFFFLGPLEYKPGFPLLLIVFLCIVNLSLYRGYRYGLQNYHRKKVEIEIDSTRATKIVRFCILFTLLWTPIRLYVGWSLTTFSLSAFIYKFIEGIYNPKDVYDTTMLLTGGTVLSTLGILVSPVVSMSIPLGVYYYKKLPAFYRIVVVLLVVLEIINSIGLGQRKMMFDTIIIVSFCYIAQKEFKFKSLKTNFKSIFLFLLAIAGILFYFLYSSVSRSGVEDITGFLFKYDIKSWYQNNLSPEMNNILSQIDMYLCQPYENLSFALAHWLNTDREPIWSLGLGNNAFTINMFNKYLGIDIWPFTYQNALLVNYQRQIGLQWMTIYPWIANDVTFLGVPFVIYWLGRIYAQLWMDCLYRNNIYSIPLFCFAAIAVFYSFANNQVLSASLIPVLVLFILYRNNQKKYV